MMTISKFFKEEEDLLYKIGQKKGIIKGEARGRQSEREKALEEKKQIARNLKNKGIDLYIISDATGIAIEEIHKL